MFAAQLRQRQTATAATSPVSALGTPSSAAGADVFPAQLQSPCDCVGIVLKGFLLDNMPGPAVPSDPRGYCFAECDAG